MFSYYHFEETALFGDTNNNKNFPIDIYAYK